MQARRDMLVPGARVLRVLREGGATSVVAQMPQSNTVLQCTVDPGRGNVRAHELREGRVVTLEVLSCARPGLVVGVIAVLTEEEQEARGLENFRRWQEAFSRPARAAGAAERVEAAEAAPSKRRRPCFFADDDEGGSQNQQR